MPDRLRFDFTHFSPVTADELAEITRLVNDEILKATGVTFEIMNIDAAKEKGAMALFGEKYGDEVRVVSVPGFSVELCGGSHVHNTAIIGQFRILSEGGIGSGVRRIEAVTGKGALALAQQEEADLKALAHMVKGKPHEVVAKVRQIMDDAKAVEHELNEVKKELRGNSLDGILAAKFDVNGVAAVVAKVEVGNMGELRDMADMIRDHIGSGVILLGSVEGEKVNFVGMATKDVVGRGIHCGNLVKAAAQAAGGNGGGRPDMAQAGGKDASAIDAALEAGRALIADMIK